jgi:chemotaxis protein MotB
MAKKRKHHEEEEGGEAWLLPYSDLMTLLLAVFIVLYAVGQTDQVKVKEMAEAFRENMMSEKSGIFSGEGDSIIPMYPDTPATGEPQNNSTRSDKADVTPTQEANTSKEDSNITKEELAKFLGQYELENMEELKSKLDIDFKNEKISTSVTTRIDMRGLVISLNNAILFDSGSADIKKGNEKTLLEIAKKINELDNYIRIEGHTDNMPIRSVDYPSNWELSTARAASVVRLFINKGDIQPDKLVAVGYGEYKPVASNKTQEGRAQNRRIDIIVLSEKYNNLEK